MAIVANTFTRYDAKGIREDLANVIYNISPEETPFQSNTARVNVKNTFFEWQTDVLAAANASNAAIEGDDISSRLRTNFLLSLRVDLFPSFFTSKCCRPSQARGGSDLSGRCLGC